MSFYLKQLEIGLKNFDIELYFEKKISKNEKNFLRLLLREYSDQRNNFVEVLKSKVCKLFNFSSDEEIISFLDRFMKKKVLYSIRNEEKNIGSGAFHVLSSYFLQDESIICMLSTEILLSFSKNNFFHSINLNSILNFENNNSTQLYLKFLGKHQAEGEMDFSIEELRNLFSVGDAYDRYYDFEKNILKPVIDDLNKYSDFEITYSKLKSGEAHSCRIIGIKFDFKNKFVKEKKEEANQLLSLVKNEVKDFELVHKILFENLLVHDYDYVYSNLLFTKANYKNNFGKFLIKALNEDLSGIIAQVEEKNHMSVDKKVNSLYELHEEVNKLLYNFPNLKDYLGTFYRDLHRLKDGEKLKFKNNYIKIDVHYNKNNKSRIEVTEV